MRPNDKAKQETNRSNEIKKIISDHLGISLTELIESADLRTDLNAEKIEISDLLSKLEKEFSVNLFAENLSNFKTVDDIIEFFKES